jgi:hypothetical protein
VPASKAKPAAAKASYEAGSFNPTKPGKKTYSKAAAGSVDLSDKALAEKLTKKM